MNKTKTPKLTKSLIRNSDGVFFDLYWDETNNSIHLIENSNSDKSLMMFDFTQTRGVNIQ